MALGKGLGSLIPNKKNNNQLDELEAITLDDKRVVEVPPAKIIANPWQPRQKYNKEKLNDLAQSIREHGILQPLVVSKAGGQYQLIAGERRLKAAELLGLKTVPVIVKEVSDRDKLELSIIENVQRANLNPMEEAESYKRLMEEFGLNHEELSKHIGRSVSAISNALRRLNLPIVIREALAEGKITGSHAKHILAYHTKAEQIKIFKKILKNDMTVGALQNLTKKNAEKAREQKPPDPVLASWEDKISKKVGAKTTIQKRGEKGYLKISFFSHEELKNILDKLT